MRLNKNIYKIEYSKLIAWLTPVLLRKPVIMAWLTALIKPITDVYAAFILYKDKYVSYKLQITPQVCYLEKLLNDWYDVADRGIYIADSLSYDALLLYLHDENKLIGFSVKAEAKAARTLYTKSETGAFACDFIVFIPALVVPVTQSIEAFKYEVGALIDSYKLASKIYKIQIY